MFKEDDDEEDNTFGVTRYPCMPSLVALQQMRNRLHLANLGKKLMKWTAVAAMTELRNIALQIDSVYKNFSEDMCEAFIMLARCRYFNPSLNQMVVEGCPNQAEICVTSSTRTASGVKVIKYEIIENNTHPYEHLGIGKGGQMILDTKKTWLDLLKRIILMVELRKNFKLVEEMQKSANKKMNVLGKVVVPKCKATCTYIIDALEELARDEFYRRKMILEVKGKGEKDPKCSSECSLICDEDENKPMHLAMNDHVTQILQLVNSIDDKKFSESDIKDFLGLGEELKSKLYDSIKPTSNFDEIDDKDNAKTDIPAEHKVQLDTQLNLPLDEKENMDPVEVEIKEITKIVRIRNKDGTYREVKKTIKIQKETKIIENTSNLSVSNNKVLYEPSTSSSKSTPSRETRIQMINLKNCNIPTQQTKVRESDKKLNTVLCDNLVLEKDLSESSLEIDMEYLKSKYFCTNCPICKELSSEIFKVQDIEELYEKYQLDEKNLFETEEMKGNNK
ncbi:V-type proton ATPase subunit D 1 [Papilio machaon]|uniref:V-type proton ATPase subunit D 1 n=1 Tax=Papilio machaon TaxID=76193 RepID=A0A194R0F3_PAPMA|nr:V-type proton ATPase subunit D 1 [Papilio machaon]